MDLQAGTPLATCIPPELHACPIVVDGTLRDVGWLLAHDAPSAHMRAHVWSAIWNASTREKENPAYRECMLTIALAFRACAPGSMTLEQFRLYDALLCEAGL